VKEMKLPFEGALGEMLKRMLEPQLREMQEQMRKVEAMRAGA